MSLEDSPVMYKNRSAIIRPFAAVEEEPKKGNDFRFDLLASHGFECTREG